MENMQIYEACRAVPPEAQRPINAGRLKGKTDIDPMWRIKKLTELFGPCGFGWYYTVEKEWTQQCGEEIAVFVNINMYINIDGKWSQPIHGTGGNTVFVKESRGMYCDDEAYKKATTDAISVACKQLGIGADIYWGADRTKYTGYEAPQEQPRKRRLSEQKCNEIFLELSRTGVGKNHILRQYNVQDIHDMTDEQYDECMKVLKAKPDNPKPAGQPWGTPGGR